MAVVQKVHDLPQFARTKFFCPLCGVKMSRGSFCFWCRTHGAFQVMAEADRPIVKKVDKA